MRATTRSPIAHHRDLPRHKYGSDGKRRFTSAHCDDCLSRKRNVRAVLLSDMKRSPELAPAPDLSRRCRLPHAQCMNMPYDERGDPGRSKAAESHTSLRSDGTFRPVKRHIIPQEDNTRDDVYVLSGGINREAQYDGDDLVRSCRPYRVGLSSRKAKANRRL